MKNTNKTKYFQKINLEDWNDIKKYYDELLNREIKSFKEIKNWFLDRDQLDAVISEEAGWRYIRMTCDTSNKTYLKDYEHYVTEILPKIEIVSNKLDNKALNSEYINQLKKEPGFDILIKGLETEAKIYNEENVSLSTQIQLQAQKYSAIIGKMTIKHSEKEITLQQAATRLEKTDRDLREKIYKKIGERRLKDKDQIDQIFSDMIKMRHKMALNSGFNNFTEYMFMKLKRFDYSIKDCAEFHESIKEELLPIINELSLKRKEALNISSLKPWDLNVDISLGEPLKPFNNEEELLSKTINTFNEVDPSFGIYIKTMKEKNHLDLFSRKNKAPGGYQYPLDITGIPFIFMNATHTLDDMITILHEGGHAVHSFLVKNFEMNSFKHTSSEVAEVASMAMELISMEHWHFFFDNEEDLNRAKRSQLLRVISILPWVAIIDKFQHKTYENPNYSKEERKKMWNSIFSEFSDNIIDWEGLQEAKDYIWQKQLHLFEVPFYYIEYAISQLAAIAIWKNYKQNQEKGIRSYINALKLGSMKSIPEIYKAAGIEFSFKKEYINELITFIKKEIKNLF